jgi:hypothetical protein
MVQEILVAIIFIAALSYIGRLVYKQFQAKSACASGCAKCSVVDFKKIEAELKSKNIYVQH